MSEPRQKKLQKHITYVSKIYKDWYKIVSNCTNPLFINVDVRQFSLYQLYRARSIKWVDDWNTMHSENRPPPTEKEYPYYMINNMLDNVDGSTIALLNYVNRDKEQIKLIGRDITNGLLRRANGSF